MLTAANQAFDRRDLAAATDLYQRVLNTPGGTGEQASLSGAIDGYASFRSVIARLLLGREDEAREQYEDTLRRDANAPFTRLSQQFWVQYSMTADVAAACAQTTPQVGTQASAQLGALAAAGVDVAADRVCSVPR